jgi:ATP phosphoribosyltransferase
VLDAEGKRYLMMNVPEARLDEVCDALPGMDAPTVMDIAGREAVAVHTVVDEDVLYGVIDDVRRRGASDVLVTGIERLVE